MLKLVEDTQFIGVGMILTLGGGLNNSGCGTCTCYNYISLKSLEARPPPSPPIPMPMQLDKLLEQVDLLEFNVDELSINKWMTGYVRGHLGVVSAPRDNMLYTCKYTGDGTL